ncbi:hypothetical protein KIW84_UN0419 [Lathyrus oleraceus]|nr:hypothetical protein KIW84_UN0419 [Pisum sativum]
MRLSREATEQRFKEYIDQCIEEFCVAQEQRIALLQNNVSRSVAQRHQRIRECRAEYRADAEQRIKKLRADAEQRINEFRAECRVETEQRIKECRAETEQRIKECRVEYGAAAGQRIKECREEAEQRINEFRADPVITLCGHLFCWPCLYKWLHHRSHPQECPVCKGVVGEEKLVPLYGKGRSVTDPRTEIPPRPSDIHTLFASLEQMRLSREATEQRFKEYIDQCIGNFVWLKSSVSHYFRRLKSGVSSSLSVVSKSVVLMQITGSKISCGGRTTTAYQEASCGCRAAFRECRVETEQRIKECRAETKQRIKECRVEYGAAAGQRIRSAERRQARINEFRAIWEENEISDCTESIIVSHYFRRLKSGVSSSLSVVSKCRADADYRIKKFRAEAEQRIKECRAEADQRIRECRAEYRADAEQRIKKLRADAEQRINEFRVECRVETEQRIKECRAETEQRIKECRVEYGAAAGQRIKECREEAEQRINEFRAVWGNMRSATAPNPSCSSGTVSMTMPVILNWLHHRSHPQECPVCKGVVGEEKLVPLYGKGRSVTDPRTEIPPRPSDIHTLFASLEQMRLSREATEQRFKEYIDQCIEDFVLPDQKVSCGGRTTYQGVSRRGRPAYQECRAEYRADAEQRIKKLRADAEQCINEFRARCRVETEQRIKECRAETEQRIKECRVSMVGAAGQRIKECREEAEQRINEFRAVWEEQ